MNAATIAMGVIAAALTLIVYLKGETQCVQGLKIGGSTMLGVLPLLIFAFIIAGMIQVLIPRPLISRWLGEEAGLKGIMIGCLAGGLTPGGPYVSFPIVASIYQAGAGIGTVVAYVTAWSLWAVPRLPFEIGLIGTRLTLFRFISTLVFPPLAGIIAQTFFSRFA